MKTATTKRKELIIMAALAVLAVVIFSRNVLNVGASAPPVAEKTSTDQGKQSKESSARNSLDPSIRLSLLRTAENTEYKGNGRNIFKSLPDIPQPVADPMAHHATYTVISKPPPPPITLKFYGFASGAGPKRVFLSQDGDIFIAKEGDIVDRRYKVVRINANSVDIEDVLNNNTQPVPLTEGPVSGQGPGQ